MKDYPSDTREKAIALRKEGYSYGLITEELGVSKSTLCGWLKDIEAPVIHPRVIDRIGAGRAKGGRVLHLRRMQETAEIREEARREIGGIARRDLWLAGIALYWGEGTKSNEEVGISNSDPKLIEFMMHWFREICLVPEQNFKVEIYLYPDNDVEQTKAYWSRVTGLSRSQFYEPRIDGRQNKRQKKKNMLPYGTARIRIRDKKLHRRIMGWMEALGFQGERE